MSLLQAIILGIIQGLTEFLPISSSAHLVLIPFLFGWVIPEDQVFVFDVLVQMGTLLAVIAYFRIDLIIIISAFIKALFQRRPFNNHQARMGWYLILATIPAGLLGILLKDKVEAVFNSPVATALFLFLTATLLLLSEYLGHKQRQLDTISWKDAILIGCAQAISIFPGVSRSGSAISGGLARNFDRPTAARFSFLMAIPVMLAAGLLALFDLAEIPNIRNFLPSLIIGVLTAAVVGYLSIRWLLAYLANHSLRSFAVYCAALASLTLIIWYV